jgi:hypothetical protein
MFYCPVAWKRLLSYKSAMNTGRDDQNPVRRKIMTDAETGELRIDPTGMTKAEKIMASVFDPSLIQELDPLTPLDDPESMEEILTEYLKMAYQFGFPVPLAALPEPIRSNIEDARTQAELDQCGIEIEQRYKLPSYQPPLCINIVFPPDGQGEPHITLLKDIA